uniref:AlNc14C393G11303 protein n=1 Tax=Albugo laibachii Nc14 TaxID=890382 RepID=F0WYP0_9STRA|nr:AlNc14C393G11303 [Albugo laibachii Nc14]|eukprot:CCA26599.1 AlNc14C393G11303 [Albugo laibachii Nc14]
MQYDEDFVLLVYMVRDTYNQHSFFGAAKFDLCNKNSEWPFTSNAVCTLALIDYLLINTNDNRFLRA